MDESNGDPSLHSTAGDGERQSSPVRESRLAALRREDSVLQGGYSSSGRTSPTLLQRSNSIQNTDKSQWSSSQQSGVSSPTTRSRSFRAQGSPSSSRSDLLSWSHSPRALSPESLLPELRRGSPRFRSTSGRLAFQQFTRVATFSKRGRGRLLKKSGTLFFVVLFLWFTFGWWYLSGFQQTVPQTRKNLGSLQADIVSSTVPLYLQLIIVLTAHVHFQNYITPIATKMIFTVYLFLII